MTEVPESAQYTFYPAIDKDNNFPPRVRSALINTPELLGLVRHAEEVANGVVTRANNGDFRGGKGEKGDPGSGWVAIELGTTNLNDVNEPGLYRQTGSANATLERNYPIQGTQGAGVLQVVRQGASATQSIIQEFSVVWGNGAGRVVFRRSRTSSVWTPWYAYGSTRSSLDSQGFRILHSWDEITSSEIQTYGPGGLTSPANLGDLDLNNVLTPGNYSQVDGGKGLLSRNYPQERAAGSLTVKHWGGSSGVVQEFTAIGNPAGSITTYGTWVRTSRSGTFSPWRAYSLQRVDTTAGRAIYTWDDTSNREQLIYGDTGWRSLSNEAAMFLNDFICTSAIVRRVGNLVTLNFDGFKSATANGNAGFIVMPAGFRHDVSTGGGNQRYATATELTGINATIISPESTGGSTLSGILRFLSYTKDRALHGSVSYYTRDPWPTLLPGSAVGTIPTV